MNGFRWANLRLRFKDVVIPCGGPDIYLTRKYGESFAALEFAQWIRDSFPDDPSAQYADTLSTGPCAVRAWQLGFRSEYGIAGCSEPEESAILLSLILSEGPLGMLIGKLKVAI